MQTFLEEKIESLNGELGKILENMSSSSIHNVDKYRQISILSFLPMPEYLIIEKEILVLRDDIYNEYLKSNTDVQSDIRNALAKYENILLVLIPNKDLFIAAENKQEFMLKILIGVAIQNLNDDIRELIIYMNELRKISKENNVDFNEILKKVIPISSDIKTIYSISMKTFFENVLHRRANPVEGNQA